MTPTKITITIDPIKGPNVDTPLPLEQTYLVLAAVSNTLLISLLNTKQTNLVQSVGPNGNGRPTLVS